MPKSDDVSAEIQALLNSGPSGPAAVSPDSGKTDEPVEEDSDKGDDGDSDQAAEEDASEDGGEEGEEDGEAESEPESSEDKSEIDALKKQVAVLTKAFEAQSKSKEKEPEEVVEPVPQVTAQDFIDDDSFEKVLENREAFNDVLNKVFKGAVEFATEAVLKRIPQVVQRQVTHETSTQQMVDSFYRRNKDLLPLRNYVAVEYQEVLSESPELALSDALNETAKRLRKKLGMAKVGAAPVNRRDRKPSLPDGSRSRPQQPRQPKGIAAEIAALREVR